MMPNPLPLALLELLLLCLLPPPTSAAGIRFLTPAAGATLPAGPLTATWTDAGGSPPLMAALTTYSLSLLVGGNSAADSAVLATLGTPGALVATGSVSGTIAPDLAQSIENGFYLRMVANTSAGDQMVNFSERFTLVGLTGATAAGVLQGANGAGGEVPEAQYNVLVPPAGTGAATTTSASETAGASTATTTATAAATAKAPPLQPVVSSHAIVGLSIGLLVAVVLISAASVWALLRWRRKRKAVTEMAHRAPAGLDDKAELAGDDRAMGFAGRPVELSPDAERFEAESPVCAVEMGTGEGRAEEVFELEGEWSGWEVGAGRESRAYDPTL